MKNIKSALSPLVVLAAGLALLFVLLCFRNTGLYPTILSDETTYNIFARLVPYSEATVPSYLYFALFRMTSSCGDGFLDCARIFNSLLYIAAAPFVYLVARKLMRPAVAVVVALLSVGSATNVYTAFFMPEASYFFAFWALSWSVLQYAEKPSSLRAIVAGALLGVLSLIKVHAVFLGPAVILFLAINGYLQRHTVGAHWMRDAVRSIVLVLLAAAVVRFGVGYLLAGTKGLNLFGTLYGAQAAQSPATHKPLLTVATTALGILLGHVIGLILLLCVPIASLLAFILSRSLRTAASPQLRATTLFGVLALCSLVAVTVMFSVSVSGTGYDTDQRLHMRYYDFVLPFLIILLGAQIDAPTPASRRLTLALGGILTLALIYAFWCLPQNYTPLIIDSPALHGMSMNKDVYRVLSFLALATLLTWAYVPRFGARMFLFVFLPLTAAGGSIGLNRQLGYAHYADAYVNGARFAHEYLDKAQIDNMQLMGPSLQGLYKAKIYLDSPTPVITEVAEPQKFDFSALARKKNWLLLVGDFNVDPAKVAQRIEGKGYTLVKLGTPSTPGVTVIDFSDPILKGAIVQSRGLSNAEGFGRWSDAEDVELTFAAPLPANFTLELTSRAFGPNIGREVTVNVGAQGRRFKAKAEDSVAKLDFQTDGAINSIKFKIPAPTSPKELGNSEDQRKLGLAFQELRIYSTVNTDTSKR
jgi:phosphoglycerol transferase